MESEPNGARPRAEGSLHALVIYLPEPLGVFLDDLRLELVPRCNPHAHVSVLPPRPLFVTQEAAVEHTRKIVAGFAPFDVELGGIEKFDATDVLYLTVERGAEQLRQMHQSLNQGVLAFDEPFAYHPHVTLAQEIEPQSVEAIRDLAVRRWREYAGPRSFRAQSVVFVRNTRGNLWVDLANEPLLGAPVR